MGKRLEELFEQKDVQMENKYIRCSTLLVIREMQFETIMRYYCTLFRITKFIKSDNIKCC